MFRLLVSLLVWYIVLTVVTALLTMDSDELRMRMWRFITSVCQTLAHGFGRIGLYAENRYNTSRSSVL